MGKSNSFSNGPGAGNSAYNGNSGAGSLKEIMHPEFHDCIWCLQGIR